MTRSALWLLAAVALSAGAAPRFEYDVVLSGGRVVDGTGAPWFRADVGLRGDRIAAIGDLSRSTARRRIELAGQVVAPGFIDMLGQSELALLVDNRVESKIRQGITTEITGEGRTVAPIDESILKQWKPFLDRFQLQVDWRDLDGYARRFERTRSAINLATFVSATNLRQLVIGAQDVQPTPDQLGKMEALLEQSLAQGALGLSTALIYPPATYARRDELVALAKVAARHDGIYATHVRSEAQELMPALEEAISIGREAGIPVEIWHLKVAGAENWGQMKAVLALIERARREGVDVTANAYPYQAASNGLTANIPPWAQEGGHEAMLARFRDPVLRERIKRELWKTSLGIEAPERTLLVISSSPKAKPFLGKYLSQVAAELGLTPEEALLHVLEVTEGSMGVVREVMSEEDVRLAISTPWVSLGTDGGGAATDGPFAGEGGHPRSFGTMPRVLGPYVRELALFSLEEAVRKMTSLPARRVRLLDRGLLRPGMFADVTVFDPERVRDLATYESPARYSEGIEYVIVNGKVVLDGGKMTSERPGRFLRRPPADPRR